MIINKEKDLENFKKSGKELECILIELKKLIKPGMSTMDISELADHLFEKNNTTSAFLGYKPDGATTGFPYRVCISVNEEIAHGVPNKSKILKSGDIVSVDCGVKYAECFTDAAFTVVVGDVAQKNKDLLSASSECLKKVSEIIKTGVCVSEIGRFIENFVQNRGFFIVSELGGHGIGHKPHEEPFIFNFYNEENKYKLSENEIIAIEPIISTKKIKEIKTDNEDGYTYYDPNRSLSCHFEHTFIVTNKKAVSLTGKPW